MKLQTKITLEPVEHRYYKDGVIIDAPSITQICGIFGKSYDGVDPWYAARGTAVHAGCALMNEGNLDWDSVDPEIEPYLRSYEKFLLTSTCKPISWEIPLYSETHGYCGTYDLLCESKTEQMMLLDIKTAKSVDPITEIQLMGQEILCVENGIETISNRGYLQLMSDGTEAKKKFYERNTTLFLAALELYKWKTKKKARK